MATMAYKSQTLPSFFRFPTGSSKFMFVWEKTTPTPAKNPEKTVKTDLKDLIILMTGA